MAEGGQNAILHHIDQRYNTIIPPACSSDLAPPKGSLLRGISVWLSQQPPRENEGREEKGKGLLEGPAAEQEVGGNLTKGTHSLMRMF